MVKSFQGDKDKKYEFRSGVIKKTRDGGLVTNAFSNSFGNQGYDVNIIKMDINGEIPGCPYIKEVYLKEKSIFNNIEVKTLKYSLFNFTWDIKDARFKTENIDFKTHSIYQPKPSNLGLISPLNDSTIRDFL